jgi:transcriptional regulator with XRE-family HTH domain
MCYRAGVRLADQVRRARVAAGLSQRELAERAGMPQSTVARIETERLNPRWDTVVRLLDAAGFEAIALPRPGDGVDRTVIRELLKLSPRQRIEQAVSAASAVERLRRGRPA